MRTARLALALEDAGRTESREAATSAARGGRTELTPPPDRLFYKKSALDRMEQSESEILRRARDGDEFAVRTIIEKYERRVAATVTGILGRGPEVEDIGQETFVRFFRSLARFRGDSQTATYITRIAINLSLNELKRRKRYAVLFDPDPPDKTAPPSSRKDEESAADIRRMIRQGLRQLPPKFRAVIALRLIGGYSTRETAEILRLSQGTVLSRMARGQARLRKIIEGMSAPKS